MSEATIRDLRNTGGAVIERVLAGETVTITRDGEPVAELRPLPRRPLGLAALLERCATLPSIDPDQLRSDIDALIDQDLLDD